MWAFLFFLRQQPLPDRQTDRQPDGQSFCYYPNKTGRSLHVMHYLLLDDRNFSGKIFCRSSCRAKYTWLARNYFLGGGAWGRPIGLTINLAAAFADKDIFLQL